jgi:hypothetical protein
MNEEIRISGYCPEIARGGYFSLEEVLRISPRILKTEGDRVSQEVGRVQGIRQGFIFRNRYTLRTSGKDVRLDFYRKDKGRQGFIFRNRYTLRTSGKDVRLDFYRKDKGRQVLLGLPRNYCWGREVLEQQKPKEPEACEMATPLSADDL